MMVKKIMSRVTGNARVLIDMNHDYDLNIRTGIITMVYIERNHKYDFD